MNFIKTIKMDQSGRIVIPKEWREWLGLEGDIEIQLDSEGIFIKKKKGK